VAGLAAVFGNGAMTNSIAEIEDADVILITGTNTTENHPIIAHFIKRAVERRSAKLIVADPRRIDLVDQANYWLRQRPGTDVAWLNGLMHWIIKKNLHDKEYIGERCEGFEELAAELEAYTPERVQEITGIPAGDLKAVAELIGRADRVTFLYAMGITQHVTGTDNVKSIANLAMITGNVGRWGTGVNPLRGQNNVQGACDMGCLPNVLPGYAPVTDAQARKNLETVWGVNSLPDQPGLTVTEMMPAARRGDLRGMYIMGENPALTDANTRHVEEALSELDFLVVQDIFPTETTRFAHVVLPGVSWAEKDGTFTNTERRVQLVRAAINPVGNSFPDWRIIQRILYLMGAPVEFSSPEQVFNELRRVTPSYAGITYARIEREGGLQWPCPDIDHPGTVFLHEGGFRRGKGLLTPIRYRPPAEEPDAEFPLLLTTGRLQYHYHTGSMTRRCRSLSTLAPEAVLDIHPEDAANLGVEDGGRVALASRRGRIEIRSRVSPSVDRGVVFTTFHFSEAPINRLTNDALDPVAKIPEFKVCAVRVEKI
jgi:formate dehydrogenase alpha subunit